MNVRPPQFLVDVFRDLRDRRLLIPAVALAVGLVAVPMLLSRTAETPPAPLAPPGDVALDGLATEPAVLAENVSVRDYRRRLEELNRKNPFSRQFSVPAAAAGAGLEDAPAEVPVSGTGGISSTGTAGSIDTTGSISTDNPTTSADTIASDTTTGSSGSSGSSGGSGSGSGDGGDGGDGGDSSSEPAPVITRFMSYRIDVVVGPVGDATPRDDVEQLRLLPSNSRPVVAFLGATDDGAKAVFLVSDEVASTSGDGRCFSSASNCQYLVMGEGDERTFDYTPNATTYRLKLKRITAVELKDAPDISVP